MNNDNKSGNKRNKSKKNPATLILVLTIIVVAFTPMLISRINSNTKGGNVNNTKDLNNNISEQTEELHSFKGYAIDFVEYLLSKDYEKAVSNFDDTMAKALNKDALKNAWEKTISVAGQYKRQAEVKEAEQDSMHIVEVISEFENTGIITRVVFNPSGKVSGLWFNYTEIPNIDEGNGNSEDESKEEQDKDKNVDNSDKFNEEKVIIGSTEWALPGVLTFPIGEGPFPAIVLVHGSGPNDMDETIGPNKPFKDIAEGLAQKGIAVLRYDKRTLVHGSKMHNMSTITVKEETIDDALAAVTLLKTDERIDQDRIFILGHSLGGMLAPRIANEAKTISENSSLAGIIIMAGSPRRLEDIILSQAEYFLAMDSTKNDSEKKEELRKYEEEIIKIKELDSLDINDIDESLTYLGVPAAYWKDLNSYDAIELTQNIEVPILILHGEKDFQVFMEDFELWKEKLSSRKDITFKLYPQLNHIFMELHIKGTPEDYQAPGHIPQYVIDDIRTWVESASTSYYLVR